MHRTIYVTPPAVTITEDRTLQVTQTLEPITITRENTLQITETLPASTVTFNGTIYVTPDPVTLTIDNTIRETQTLTPSTVFQTVDNIVRITETLPASTVTFNGTIYVTPPPVTVVENSIVRTTETLEPSTITLDPSTVLVTPAPITVTLDASTIVQENTLFTTLTVTQISIETSVQDRTSDIILTATSCLETLLSTVYETTSTLTAFVTGPTVTRFTPETVQVSVIETIRVPTTVVKFSTISVPLSTSANEPSGSPIAPSISPVLIATRTLTFYSSFAVPYPSTVLQPTTFRETSTIYIPSVQVSSITVPTTTTVFELSTITVSRVSTLTLQMLPLSDTALLPQVSGTTSDRSTIFIYATITVSFTGIQVIEPIYVAPAVQPIIVTTTSFLPGPVATVTATLPARNYQPFHNDVPSERNHNELHLCDYYTATGDSNLHFYGLVGAHNYCYAATCDGNLYFDGFCGPYGYCGTRSTDSDGFKDLCPYFTNDNDLLGYYDNLLCFIDTDHDHRNHNNLFSIVVTHHDY
ncbi:hypothetical protein SVAN01_10311 [Stagonosporopsis vannaccii]|nr:hypothetical protein SVAN01_10311 [Stagonosporopsis vannaccii]